MQILIDIKDSKVDLAIEMLNNLSFVKKTKIIDKKSKKNAKKEQFLAEFENAIDDLNLIRAGKKKSRSAKDWIDSI